MIFKCALAIWLRSLTVEISYVSSTGELVSFTMKTGNRLNISEKSFTIAMLTKFYP